MVCAVGADQTDDLARVHGEVKTLQRLQTAELYAQILDLQHIARRFGRGRIARSGRLGLNDHGLDLINKTPQ